MPINIKLPDKGEDITTVIGTRVTTTDGTEIEGVTRIRIDWTADMIAEATIDVDVMPGMTLENVHALLSTETLEQIAEMHGYDLVEKPLISNTPIDTGITHKRKP